MTKNDIYQQVHDIINQYLNKPKFTLQDLEADITKNHLPMRVAPAETINDYLAQLKQDNIIEFNAVKNEYININYKKEKIISTIALKLAFSKINFTITELEKKLTEYDPKLFKEDEHISEHEISKLSDILTYHPPKKAFCEIDEKIYYLQVTPKWLTELLTKEKTVSIHQLYDMGFKSYNIKSFHERELFGNYIEDIIEEGILQQHGNNISFADGIEERLKVLEKYEKNSDIVLKT